MSATVGRLVEVLSRSFPHQWAEPWDRVGLLAGFADRPVDGVLVTLDPTLDAVSRAAEAGANVVVAHHPAFLTPPETLTDDASPVVVSALASGVSLVAAHTNLDRSPLGAAALAETLGLEIAAPLESALQPVDLVVTYVPEESAEAVTAAMSSAGAGRIGLYEACAFSSEGTGAFTPLRGADPAVGEVGSPERTAEVRVEMVAPRGSGRRVAEAVRVAHPYEEPVVLVTESALSRGAARLGRLCRTAGASLQEFAVEVGGRLQVRPRVIGEPERLVETVAVAGGSGGSLIGDALALGADAFVCGELRYHDALAAAEAGMAIIEVGHDASEWPIVGVLADAVRLTPGLEGAKVIVDAPGSMYWTPR